MVKNKVLTFQLPRDPEPLFEPYAIRESARFIHVSSYFLPVKPRRPVITAAEYAALGTPLPYELSMDGDYLVDVQDKSLFELYPNILRRPYWYKVSVYYDIVTQTEFVVLEYNDCLHPKRPPYVRIHSESIFSRFPLKVRIISSDPCSVGTWTGAPRSRARAFADFCSRPSPFSPARCIPA